jgi:hypothetical protein
VWKSERADGPSGGRGRENLSPSIIARPHCHWREGTERWMIFPAL